MTDLSTPIPLRCGHIIPGRLCLAPLTNLQSHADGRLGPDEARWLLARAQGGFHWISTCAAYVHEQGKAWTGQLGVATDAHTQALTPLFEAAQQTSARWVVQLHHAGAKATVSPRKLGPMAHEDVHRASDADLENLIDQYAAAAKRCMDAGAHGVEVHGANGYIFTQFLAPGTNHRTDQWGGSLECRARLLRRAVRAVREAIGPRAILGVRISPVDTYEQRGLVLADSCQLAQWLADDGIDVLHVSLRDAQIEAPFEPGTGPVVSAIRAALPSTVALQAAGGIQTFAQAQSAVALGVDLVSVGRAGIRHADWALRCQPGQQPTPIPWAPDDLAAEAIGPDFITYLKRFPGLVQGGAPPR